MCQPKAGPCDVSCYGLRFGKNRQRVNITPIAVAMSRIRLLGCGWSRLTARVRLPVVHAVVATVGPLVELAGNSGGVAARQSHRSQNAFLSDAASTVEAST